MKFIILNIIMLVIIEKLGNLTRYSISDLELGKSQKGDEYLRIWNGIFYFMSFYFVIGIFLILINKLFGLRLFTGLIYSFASFISFIGKPLLLIGIIICVVQFNQRRKKEKNEAEDYYNTIMKGIQEIADLNLKEMDRFNELVKEMELIISDLFTELVQATDKEVYEKIPSYICNDYESFRENHLKSRNSIVDSIGEKITDFQIKKTGVDIIDRAFFEYSFAEFIEFFEISLHNDLKKGDLEVLTELNGSDSDTISWDKKLYRTTRDDFNSSNAMETIVIDDFD